MKSLITFLFIIVASTTYRCGKEEETIDCNEATSQMLGTWNGNLLYTLPGPQNANTANIIPGATGVNHDFVLEITSTSECSFFGSITYGEISNNTVYQIAGNIDKYGWVTFSETTYINDGEIYTGCFDPNVINQGSTCRWWPTGRWNVGGVFSKGRFTNDPVYEWEGEFRLPSSGYQYSVDGSFTNTVAVEDIQGNYKITKQ
tara:strand:- start:1106 stop:1711 length:606 start_codon:yes stop_codon:yes gene_type:complete